MNGADVPATGLIAPGSRVSYRLLLAEPQAIANYQSFVEARANEAVELVSVRDARPALRVTLERGEQYLRVTALASLFLAGIAIAMAARRFATRHLDHCAGGQCRSLRTLGATQGFILSSTGQHKYGVSSNIPTFSGAPGTPAWATSMTTSRFRGWRGLGACAVTRQPRTTYNATIQRRALARPLQAFVSRLFNNLSLDKLVQDARNKCLIRHAFSQGALLKRP